MSHQRKITPLEARGQMFNRAQRVENLSDEFSQYFPDTAEVEPETLTELPAARATPAESKNMSKEMTITVQTSEETKLDEEQKEELELPPAEAPSPSLA